MKNSFLNMSFEELVEKREQLKKTYMEIKHKKAISHVDNPLLIRTLRKQIARVHTRLKNIVLEGRRDQNV